MQAVGSARIYLCSDFYAKYFNKKSTSAVNQMLARHGSGNSGFMRLCRVL